MSYLVSAGDLSSVRLQEEDTVRSVLQNIAVILATPKGSVPLYRTFGLAQDFLDRPMSAAKVMMIAAVKEAVEEWEPRAQVTDVTFQEDVTVPGQLIPTVEVDIIGE